MRSSRSARRQTEVTLTKGESPSEYVHQSSRNLCKFESTWKTTRRQASFGASPVPTLITITPKRTQIAYVAVRVLVALLGQGWLS